MSHDLYNILYNLKFWDKNKVLLAFELDFQFPVAYTTYKPLGYLHKHYSAYQRRHMIEKYIDGCRDEKRKTFNVFV